MTLHSNVDITIDVHNGKDASTCAITVTSPAGAAVNVVGVAKRHPKDVHDWRVGELLALERAFKQAGHRLGAQAESLLQAAQQREAVLARSRPYKTQRALEIALRCAKEET